MATWVTPIPPNDVVAGDPGHPGMHNDLSDNITEIRTNVDLVESEGLQIGTTATTAAAGNDVRLLTGTATAIPDSTAAVLADLVTDFNELLAELRDRGVLAP